MTERPTVEDLNAEGLARNPASTRGLPPGLGPPAQPAPGHPGRGRGLGAPDFLAEREPVAAVPR
jgi:hypothetical protein